ncbi:hypothetical protein NFI96_002720 [Prochilodus magdalenae]|nr:hypothetical protein NFI96_002720 [Prochilodus magdalenae]
MDMVCLCSSLLVSISMDMVCLCSSLVSILLYGYVLLLAVSMDMVCLCSSLVSMSMDMVCLCSSLVSRILESLEHTTSGMFGGESVGGMAMRNTEHGAPQKNRVLLLTWVSVTSSTMVRYLDPTEVAQEYGGDSRRQAVTLGKVDKTVEGLVSAPLCKEEQDKHCQSPTAVNVSDQTIRNRPHEGGMRARCPVVGPVLTGQHRRARLAFATEHQNWQIRHRRLVLFTDESRFHLSTCDRHDRLWRRRGDYYAACNIIQHDWFGGGSVMVWEGISLEGRTDLYRLDNGTLTVIRYRDEILGPVVRPYAGAVGPGFLLVHNNAWPHVARVCRQFLENEGIDTIDWPIGSPDLNPIEHLWDITFRSIRRHQVALQTVQELSHALVQIWEGIPQDTIHRLIRSIDAWSFSSFSGWSSSFILEVKLAEGGETQREAGSLWRETGLYVCDRQPSRLGPFPLLSAGATNGRTAEATLPLHHSPPQSSPVLPIPPHTPPPPHAPPSQPLLRNYDHLFYFCIRKGQAMALYLLAVLLVTEHPEFGLEVRSLCLQGFVFSHRVATFSSHWPSASPDLASTSLTSLSPEDCQRPQWHTHQSPEQPTAPPNTQQSPERPTPTPHMPSFSKHQQKLKEHFPDFKAPEPELHSRMRG